MSRKTRVLLGSVVIGLVVGVGIAYAIAPPPLLPENQTSIDAAPMVPHDDYPEASCARCHGDEAAEAVGIPVTPHPERAMCRQCHVPMRDSPLFRPNAWTK